MAGLSAAVVLGVGSAVWATTSASAAPAASAAPGRAGAAEADVVAQTADPTRPRRDRPATCGLPPEPGCPVCGGG